MHSYCLAGLHVDSEVAFPGAIAGRSTSGPVDVTVREAFVPASLDNPDAVQCRAISGIRLKHMGDARTWRNEHSRELATSIISAHATTMPHLGYELSRIAEGEAA